MYSKEELVDYMVSQSTDKEQAKAMVENVWCEMLLEFDIHKAAQMVRILS